MKLITTTIFISFFGLCHGQLVLKFGPELGISASRFSTEETYFQGTNEVTDKITPLVSPIVGFQSQLILKDHFQISAGIQYQMTGIRENSYINGRMPGNSSLPTQYFYTYTQREAQTFHKLCLPLTFGYVFTKPRIRPSLFIGFRPNLFLLGKYSFRDEFDAPDDTLDESLERQYNPLSIEHAAIPLDRVANQFLLGSTMVLSEKVMVNLTYYWGNRMYYSKSEGYYGGWSRHFTSFNNSDFGISAVYFLSQ